VRVCGTPVESRTDDRPLPAAEHRSVAISPPATSPAPRRCRRRAAVAALAALLVSCAAVAPAQAAGPPFRDADYWAFADRSFAELDSWWNPARQAYVKPGHGAQIRPNAGLLAIHAIAALEGHAGPARNDARARLLVGRLTRPPAYRGRRARLASHTVCWSASLSHRGAGHAAIEPKVAEALAWAWRARTVLGLSRGLTARLVREVDGCARRPHWGFPPAVANQINWNSELYAAAATVTRSGSLLRSRYRRLLGWFADGITRPAPGAVTSHLGPGYSFHYLPDRPATAPINLDMPEYASIVVQFLEHYDHALRVGMQPLPAHSMRLLRAWVRRLLAGAWTHGGFLNWDSGYGHERWMSGQYWAFAQQGLIAIAASPRFRTAQEGRWAKAILDRGLMLYRRLADEADSPVAPQRLFGVRSSMENEECYCVRVPLNAARAVGLGLGDMAAEDPPPLYAFDYDTGRLAVTTPAYSTAIVPDNRGAFPYGGIEPARLFGPGQRVVANIGGTPPASFGVVLRDGAGRTLLASQHVRTTPLRLLRFPQGAMTRPRPYPRVPYAGRFKVVEVQGTAVGGGARVTSRHRFTATAITSHWTAVCATGRCERARILFPTWGAGAVITAVHSDGSGTVIEPGARLPLDDIDQLRLGTGYTVEPLIRPAHARLRTVAVEPQATDPDPGPTLAVEVTGRPLRHLAFAARIVPAARR
jgi:hypothetical protein